MHNYVPSDTLLFTKCTNLNTEQCLYTKKPEVILSLISSPENAINDQKERELNATCSGCIALHMKTMET
jgi:hypothetical protein